MISRLVLRLISDLGLHLRDELSGWERAEVALAVTPTAPASCSFAPVTMCPRAILTYVCTYVIFIVRQKHRIYNEG